MDSNDVQFNEYSLDFFGFLKLFFSGGAAEPGSAGTAGTGYETVGGGLRDTFLSLIDVLSDVWSILVVLSWLFSALLIFGIIYTYLRLHHFEEEQGEVLRLQERLYQELYGTGAKNSRWDDVLAHIATDSPKDWRLAIIEADIILDEALRSAGYAGNTVGEMLKSASPQTFTTLDQAWAAHLVRNKIAHAGSDFVLTKKLAQETITQYRMAFEELGVV